MKVHLSHPRFVGAACGLLDPPHETRDPAKVTCEACRACTMHMAAAAGALAAEQG